MIDYLMYFLLLIQLTACNTQTKSTLKNNTPVYNHHDIQQNITDTSGTVYFSFDNGNSWKKTNKGLPENISIGLGSISTSDNQLALVTKESGVYIFDFNNNIWTNFPTDEQILKNNVGALIFFKNDIYLGTQNGGVYTFNPAEKKWKVLNNGLITKTIRRFEIIGTTLYVCTNNGLYSLDENKKSWTFEYGNNSLQVNGVTTFNNYIYIATNQGVYKKDTSQKKWEEILSNHSVHNISADEKNIYAMTYNELLLRSKDGITWQKAQDGLPKELYTFNIITQNDVTFAAQWDGIYKKTNFDLVWEKSSNGLPEKFAATNLSTYKGILITTTSKSKTKQ